MNRRRCGVAMVSSLIETSKFIGLDMFVKTALIRSVHIAAREAERGTHSLFLGV